MSDLGITVAQAREEIRRLREDGQALLVAGHLEEGKKLCFEAYKLQMYLIASSIIADRNEPRS